MKLTEKALLDNYSGITNGGDYISMVKGIHYFWSYHNDEGVALFADNHEDASYITLTNNRAGTVKVSPKWRNHKSLELIYRDECKFYGIGL